jgi:hypothetical protein
MYFRASAPLIAKLKPMSAMRTKPPRSVSASRAALPLFAMVTIMHGVTPNFSAVARFMSGAQKITPRAACAPYNHNC